MRNFDQLMKAVETQPVRSVAVAAAQDYTVLQAARDALDQNVARSVLVGDKDQIQQAARDHSISLDGLTIVHEPDRLAAARKAVEMTSSGQTEIVMKGYIHTDDFLRAVLDRDVGLRAGVVMSHVFIIEVPEMSKFLFVTDAAMNIAPNLEQKAEILLNAVHLANIFGVTEPKVAVLAAVELLNPAMPATVDATCLHKMSERGQFVPGCIVDGPFGMDNAINEMAAKHKKLSGPVAGNADILLVPDIEAGNILVKALVFLGHMREAGVIVGAKAPVVLTSRADSAEAKLFSIAAAVFMYDVRRALRLKIGKVHY
jgi:phosphate butyryltransferase